MLLPTHSTLDVLNFGERISALKAEDHPLFLLCLGLVWQAALAQQGLNPRVTKVTMTTEPFEFLVKTQTLIFWHNVHRKRNCISNFPH